MIKFENNTDRSNYILPHLLKENYNIKNAKDYQNLKLKNITLTVKNKILLEPMDSTWPMYCHDTQHTGRSKFNTNDNPGYEKWQLYVESGIKGGIVIDNYGTIYFGYGDLYSAYPNGTVKWIYNTHGTIQSVPAINKNGTIYVGIESASDKYFYAINPNGTLKWRHRLPGSVYYSSPVIGDDGTICFGLECGYPWFGYIYALYPNGTLRWKFRTNHVIYSSPAIGIDGTVYCGSLDNHVYALYLNNGTVKWKFNTGNWVHGSATIAQDGTVYIGSDNGNLYAFYPENGTVKWNCPIGYVWGSPSLDKDGTIYVGTWSMKFYALYPNGSIKWTFNAPGRIWFGNSAAVSADGTIFFGTTEQDGGKGRFIALNPDGTERWILSNGLFETTPAIGQDGTVYIGSHFLNEGYIRAYGKLDSNAPSVPEIEGPKSGRVGTEYSFSFSSTSPLNNRVYYWIEWGDGNVEEWIGPYNSGEEITKSHKWSEKGTYTIKARARDTDNLWGPWSEFKIEIPRTRASSYLWNEWILERFQMLERIFNFFNI